jgi:hypothetical protein
MAPGVFTKEQEEIINANPVAKLIDVFRGDLPEDQCFDQYISSAASNEGTQLKLATCHF